MRAIAITFDRYIGHTKVLKIKILGKKGLLTRFILYLVKFGYKSSG
jgi:hypothetical protein